MQRTRNVTFSANGILFTLSVNPKEMTVTDESKVKTIDLLNVGEIGTAGNRGMIGITISTFLPASGSHFFSGSTPETILSGMRTAKDGKNPVRIIISGTDINRQFLIEKLDSVYKEGQKDVYINWTFREYRETTMIPVASLSARADTGLNTRPDTQETPKSVTVQKGTTLWDLSKKYYGDGNRWKEIAAANGNINEKKLKMGMELKIP